MRVVTLYTSIAGEIRCRIVLVHKGARIVGVAGDARLLGCLQALSLVFVGMHGVTIAADQSAFWNGMMEVLSQFSYHLAVALTTQSGFIRLKLCFWIRLIWKDRFVSGGCDGAGMWIALLIFGNCVSFDAFSIVKVDAVAAGAGYSRTSMLRSLPMTLRQCIVVTSKARGGDLFRLDVRVTHNVAVEPFLLLSVRDVIFAGTMAAFTPYLVDAVVRIAHVYGVRTSFF